MRVDRKRTPKVSNNTDDHEMSDTASVRSVTRPAIWDLETPQTLGDPPALMHAPSVSPVLAYTGMVSGL